jgi:hypothetical protein
LWYFFSLSISVVSDIHHPRPLPLRGGAVSRHCILTLFLSSTSTTNGCSQKTVLCFLSLSLRLACICSSSSVSRPSFFG